MSSGYVSLLTIVSYLQSNLHQTIHFSAIIRDEMDSLQVVQYSAVVVVAQSRESDMRVRDPLLKIERVTNKADQRRSIKGYQVGNG